jgi:hypothetical protein
MKAQNDGKMEAQWRHDGASKWSSGGSVSRKSQIFITFKRSGSRSASTRSEWSDPEPDPHQSGTSDPDSHRLPVTGTVTDTKAYRYLETKSDYPCRSRYNQINNTGRYRSLQSFKRFTKLPA